MSRLTRTASAAAALSTIPMLALAASAEARPPAGYGPSDPYIEALLPSHGPVEPMKNQAKIIVTDYGYRITLGQQNSHLTVTLVDGKLRYEDTGTLAWKSLPSACQAQSVSVGVAANCDVPASTSTANPTLLEVHPRLGNDYVSGSGLPAVFEMAVLADAGFDTVFTGEGNDFVNGAQDADEAHGGGGKDWIRTGLANDHIWGDAGDDYMVGADGHDTADGGAGTDRIWAETITNH
jgi:hypothetical protein